MNPDGAAYEVLKTDHGAAFKEVDFPSRGEASSKTLEAEFSRIMAGDGLPEPASPGYEARER